MNDSTTAFPTSHVAPAGAFATPPPLVETERARRRTPAEEARTLVAGAQVATLATLSDDGHPWGSLVSYGVLEDGSPVLCVSTLAEHGRNLHSDQRASLMIADPDPGAEILDSGRVTLAGVAERPEGDAEQAAREAYLERNPSGSAYMDFGDFALWVLRVDRVRWVGGYGRMDSATASDYAAAESDPVAPAVPYAVAHLNEDHDDALLEMAKALAGYTDATAATCSRADRYGLDLTVETPRGRAYTRVGFAEPIVAPDGLRAATVELAKRARQG